MKIPRQIPTDTMRKFIKDYIDKNGKCGFVMDGNGEKYCHFLHWGYCPYDLMEKSETRVLEIPQRVFYRCLL